MIAICATCSGSTWSLRVCTFCGPYGWRGLREGMKASHELILLDVMLPDTRGFEVLRELRTRVRTPVLMLTAKGEEFDRVLGLGLGADDFLSKPFSPRECSLDLAICGDPRGPPRMRSIATACRYVWRHRARPGGAYRFEGQPVSQDTGAEFDLLKAFVESPGQVLTRDVLAEGVLGRKFSPFDRSIDLHVSNLRRKLGPQSDGVERIRIFEHGISMHGRPRCSGRAATGGRGCF